MYCKMTISNPQYGAEMITDRGRVLKYDALECMINYINKDQPLYSQLYAIPYDQPGKLHPVDSLQYVISSEYRSPMGANLAAFRKSNVHSSQPLMSWNILKQKIANE